MVVAYQCKGNKLEQLVGMGKVTLENFLFGRCWIGMTVGNVCVCMSKPGSTFLRAVFLNAELALTDSQSIQIQFPFR